MRSYRLLLNTLFIWMFIYSAWSHAGVAKVLSVSGSVTLTRNGEDSTLARGAELEVGDLVRTASGAGAQMKYTNGTLITLRGGTVYKTLSYSGEILESQVDGGVMDYKSAGAKKGKIQTPVVALAILGTEFTVAVNLDKTSLKVTEGLVQGGDIIIGPGQEFNSGTFSTGGGFSGGDFSTSVGSDSGGSSSSSSGGQSSSGGSTTMGNTGTPTEVAIVSNDIVATSSTAQVAAEAAAVITPPPPAIAPIELVFPQ